VDRCFALAATIIGTPGDELLRGTRKHDVIMGLGGGYAVAGVDEYDTVCSGAGDDTIRVNAGAGDLDGGQGQRLHRPNTGNRATYPTEAPCVRYEYSARGVRVDLGQGWARGLGKDTLIGLNCITGSRYDDVLVGTQAACGPDGDRRRPRHGRFQEWW
jgi:Ca2+-binding RTX toxin-like protein